MLFKNVFSILLAAQTVLAAPAASGAQFEWGKERIRGVNLGGWLVLEPWITPSLFNDVPGQTAVDEFTFCQAYGKPKARQILEQHWKTWITEADIAQVKAWGFNMVRIPVGYWAFKEFPAKTTPYTPGAAFWLEKAIGWARAHGLYVLIDLHGAPRSQNGFDNSGHRIPTPLWGTGDTVAETLQIIKMISDKYAQAKYSDVVMGIELLNEPLAGPVSLDLIRSYYNSGWSVVRKVGDRTVVLHDAFQPLGTYNDQLTPSTKTRVSLDHHEYQVFDDYHVALSGEGHRAAVCSQAEPDYGGHPGHWAFVGEWSAAFTDCATWLNGYKIGARYDGTYPNSTYVGSCKGKNDISTWSKGDIAEHRWYVETQMDAFDHFTLGWVFWTLKTAHSAEWDLYQLIKYGAFPQPLSARKYPKYCNF